MPATPEAVLDFWFGAAGSATDIAGRQGSLWFGKSAANDARVLELFADTLIAAGAGTLDSWQQSPRTLLALIVVLDQFPHHIHRDQGASFAYDAQSLALTQAMIARGADQALTLIERVFVYLPLEHAESLAAQDQAVAQYTRLLAAALPDERGLFENFLDYARQHQAVVARFGRFPHRNALLGRASSAAEIEFLKEPGSRF